MIENTNASKEPSTGTFTDYKKYVGVASIKVLSINPNNAKLRQYGWEIPEDAEEPKYVFSKEKDGKMMNYSRVRFLAQIQNLEDKPVVFLDFLCSPDVRLNKEGDKAQVIDMYAQTAWATKADIQGKKVPQYTNGPARINLPYKMCHRGEDTLTIFLHRLLNVTALTEWNKATNTYEPTKNPGRICFDNWNLIAEGNTREIAEMISTRPDNAVMVILGVQTTPDNKTYQTFLSYGDIQHAPYLGNGSRPDYQTGEYSVARKRIDAYNDSFPNNSCTFSAAPVKEWTVTPTTVEDNSSSSMFDTASDSESLEPQQDDLPW